MADVPVEVKKAPQAETTVPEVWGSFRSEMDQLFNRFARGFGLPSLRRHNRRRTALAVVRLLGSTNRYERRRQGL
jgi:hypothetical protein